MNQSRTGLTMIEVIIAMGVVVLGTFALFDALTTARRTDERARNTALAYQEIQAHIETIQYLPFLTMLNSFKGTSFKVPGLRPPNLPGGAGTRPMCGTITKLTNTNVWDTTLGPTNPNKFVATDTKMPLRFRVEWQDSSGEAFVEVVYVLTYRGI